MTQVLPKLALVVTAAGVLAAGVCVATTRDWRTALAVLLEMLTAAGLLRLAGPPSLRVTAAAGVVLAIRRLVVLGLDPARLSRLPASITARLWRARQRALVHLRS